MARALGPTVVEAQDPSAPLGRRSWVHYGGVSIPQFHRYLESNGKVGDMYRGWFCSLEAAISGSGTAKVHHDTGRTGAVPDAASLRCLRISLSIGAIES
jgi:hypothetical protein